MHPTAAQGAPQQVQSIVGEWRSASDASVAIVVSSAIYAVSAIYS
jgi:hypothetical protein